MWLLNPQNNKQFILINPKARTTRIFFIDPRGHFTALRCAIIKAFDQIMQYDSHLVWFFGHLCEVIANYPTW